MEHLVQLFWGVKPSITRCSCGRLEPALTIPALERLDRHACPLGKLSRVVRVHGKHCRTLVLICKGSRHRSSPAEPRFPLIAFSVPDLEAAVQNLQRLGIELPWGEESDPAGRWVMLRDPAGNLIELVQWTD
jgi:hypothetical protein